MTEQAGAHRVTLHHALGRTATLLVPAVGLVGAWPWARHPRAVAAVAAVACLLAALGWRPALMIGDDALVLHNPWHDVVLPWSAVQDVHMRWVLEVTAAGRRYRAWAAPGPRRLRDTRDLDWTGNVVERYAVGSVDAAARQGHGELGAADAGLLVGQRWAARRALTSPAAVRSRRSRSGVLLTAAGALLLLLSCAPADVLTFA